MNENQSALEYRASLTGEPFLFNETRLLASYLFSGEKIDTLKQKNLSENLIMHKKHASLKRVNSPIFKRLSTLSTLSVNMLANGDFESARIVLLIAVAKTDRIVRDFIFDVYADKVAMRVRKIYNSDVERYFDYIYSVEPYLQSRTDLTKAKLKQQLMKIVTEAGLVKKQGQSFLVTRPIITNKLANLLIADGDSEFIKALGGNS